mgnify:CR=1 FL=1
MNKKFQKLISSKSRPFIIAEISANHGGSFKKAKKMIDAAKKAGASAVKIQTYEADSMTIESNKKDFQIKHGIWKGKNLYDLYDSAKTPFAWHKSLFRYAKERKILIFSTPFDSEAVDLLDSLDTPFFKIASFELTDIPFIEYVASKGRPILLSTGMSNEEEVGEALETIKSKGVNDVLLFHCISSYPSKVEEYNLNMIKTLQKQFNTLIGLSDHTLGIEASIAAIALGAVAIEKHFKLKKNDKTLDSKFSISPEEMEELIIKSKETWLTLGKEKKIKEKKILSKFETINLCN